MDVAFKAEGVLLLAGVRLQIGKRIMEMATVGLGGFTETRLITFAVAVPSTC